MLNPLNYFIYLLSQSYAIIQLVSVAILFLLVLPNTFKRERTKKAINNEPVFNQDKDDQKMILILASLSILFGIPVFMSNNAMVKLIFSIGLNISLLILSIVLRNTVIEKDDTPIFYAGTVLPMFVILNVSIFSKGAFTFAKLGFIMMSIMFFAIGVLMLKQQKIQNKKIMDMERARHREMCIVQSNNFIEKYKEVFNRHSLYLCKAANDYDKDKRYETPIYNDFGSLDHTAQNILLKGNDIQSDSISYQDCIEMIKKLFEYRCHVDDECKQFFCDLFAKRNNTIQIEKNPVSDSTKEILQDVNDFVHDCLLLSYWDEEVKNLQLKHDWPEMFVDDVPEIRNDPWKYVSKKISVNINGEIINGNETLRRNAFLIFVNTLTRFEFEISLQNGITPNGQILMTKEFSNNPQDPEEFLMETIICANNFLKLKK